MDAVQLAQTVDLLNKVGKNTDSSGTSTVFSRLQQLADYVDTLETKLGLNSDASGTTTLFARLAQIAAYVDTLETNVGLNSDASGTTTLFARLKQIVDYVDTVETTLGTVNTNVSANATKIGANTDASGTSTMFALLKKLDAKATGAAVDKSACVPFSSGVSPTIALNTSYQTLYSYSGKGYLDQAYIKSESVQIVFMRITIDGVVVFEGQAAANSSAYSGLINRKVIQLSYNGTGMYLWFFSPSHNVLHTDNSAFVNHPYTANAVISGQGTLALPNQEIYFNTSVLIEAKCGASTTASTPYSYAGGKI